MMPGLTSPQETSVLCMAGIVCQMTALAQSPLLGGQRLGGPSSSSAPGSRSHRLHMLKELGLQQHVVPVVVQEVALAFTERPDPWW